LLQQSPVPIVKWLDADSRPLLLPQGAQAFTDQTVYLSFHYAATFQLDRSAFTTDGDKPSLPRGRAIDADTFPKAGSGGAQPARLISL